MNTLEFNKLIEEIYKLEEKIKHEKGRTKNILVIKLEGLKKEKNKILRSSSRKKGLKKEKNKKLRSSSKKNTSN